MFCIWFGMFIWGRVSRGSALRSYEKKLFNAARPFFQDIESGSTSMQQTISDFTTGKIKVTALATATAKWETDFISAHEAIAKLKPPDELKAAQAQFVSALEEYIGAVRMYGPLVQNQQALIDAIPAKNKDLKKKATDELGLLLQHIGAVRGRGDNLYSQAVSAITSLAKSWGVKSTTSFPAPPGSATPDGSQGLPSGLSP